LWSQLSYNSVNESDAAMLCWKFRISCQDVDTAPVSVGAPRLGAPHLRQAVAAAARGAP
jgi:hypothetical protein